MAVITTTGGRDVALMAEMGLMAIASVSWPRIHPAGRGEVNEAGQPPATGSSTPCWPTASEPVR